MWNPKSVVCPFFAERFFSSFISTFGVSAMMKCTQSKAIAMLQQLPRLPPNVMRLSHTPSSLMATVIYRIYSHRTPANTNERRRPYDDYMLFSFVVVLVLQFSIQSLGSTFSFLLSLRHQPAR